jgi:hypothetical protein
VLIEARSTIHGRHFASSLGRLTRALQMESYPKFHNEVGVSIVRAATAASRRIVGTLTHSRRAVALIGARIAPHQDLSMETL